MNVYPGILTDEIKQVETLIEICKDSSLVETVQIDVIDGFFVDNVTVFPGDLSSIDFGNLEIDFHLMTQEPMDFVHEIREHKDLLSVKSVIGQIEQMESQTNFLQEVKKYNWSAGLSLNLYTPLESIDKEAWNYLDIIQIMGVEAGFQGQKFNVSSLSLISEINDIIERKNLDIKVIVDGGVTLENIREIEGYGVDGVVVGSALWKSSDFDDTYRNFLG